MNLLEIYNAFEEIKATSSRNEKEVILAKYIHDELFQEFLQIMYNPYIVTGVGKKSLDIKHIKHTDFMLDEKELFDYLKTKSNHDKYSLQYIRDTIWYIGNLNDLENFLIEVVTKTYSCGITAKTINKVFNYEFIPEHNVMLAEQYDSKKAFKLLQETGCCFITLKLDGVRATLVKNGDSIVWLSRSGKTYEGLDELTESAKLLPDGIYDGEILYNDTVGNMSNDEVRRNTTSIMNSKGAKSGVKYVVFDILHNSKLDYTTRRMILEHKIDLYCNKDYIQILPIIRALMKESELNEIEFDSKVKECFKTVREQKQEGLMINFDVPYQKKRTKYLMKVKDSFTMDLRIVDYFTGEGEFEGLLGGFIVELPYNDNIYHVRIGSGFTIEQRKEYINNPKQYIGKIVEVKATEISQNQNGGYSLSYPVFISIRGDKNDINIEI